MAETLKSLVETRLAELGKNAFEAALGAGLERTYLYDIVNGKKRSVRGENIGKIATALEISPGEVINLARAPDAQEPEHDREVEMLRFALTNFLVEKGSDPQEADLLIEEIEAIVHKLRDEPKAINAAENARQQIAALVRFVSKKLRP